MALKIQYFASVREALDRAEDRIQLPDAVVTVSDLQAHLAQQDSAFASLCESGRQLLVAVNQTIVDDSYQLGADDEVAFFPPMTGG